MKTKNLHPAIKAVLFVLAALLFGLLTSCDTDPLTIKDEHNVQVINDTLYAFADLEYPEKGWQKKENGDIYAYTIKGDSVDMEAPRMVKRALFYDGMLDTKPIELEMKDGYKCTAPRTKNGFINFLYQGEK